MMPTLSSLVATGVIVSDSKVIASWRLSDLIVRHVVELTIYPNFEILFWIFLLSLNFTDIAAEWTDSKVLLIFPIWLQILNFKIYCYKIDDKRLSDS